jgi:hypothetical protein
MAALSPFATVNAIAESRCVTVTEKPCVTVREKPLRNRHREAAA